VNEVIDRLQKNVPEEEETYYLYVTNNKNNLLGIISLFTLITSDKSAKLYNIMAIQPKSLKDLDTIDDAVEIMQKYSLVSLPVIDEKNELVGTISLNDSIDKLLASRRVAI
jgi:Mg/Co/Ni transporter MgtE